MTRGRENEDVSSRNTTRWVNPGTWPLAAQDGTTVSGGARRGAGPAPGLPRPAQVGRGVLRSGAATDFDEPGRGRSRLRGGRLRLSRSRLCPRRVAVSWRTLAFRLLPGPAAPRRCWGHDGGDIDQSTAVAGAPRLFRGGHARDDVRTHAALMGRSAGFVLVDSILARGLGPGHPGRGDPPADARDLRARRADCAGDGRSPLLGVSAPARCGPYRCRCCSHPVREMIGGFEYCARGPGTRRRPAARARPRSAHGAHGGARSTAAADAP